MIGFKNFIQMIRFFGRSLYADFLCFKVAHLFESQIRIQKLLFCFFALICSSLVFALNHRLTPCERAIRDFQQENLTSVKRSSSSQDSSSSVIVKYWSYEDTMSLISFLKERIGVEKTIERLRSLSFLNRTNVEQFKRRVFFFDKYIGESEVNKKLRRTLRHFIRGDVQQMEAAAQFLQRYIGDQQTVQVMTQNTFVFFKLNVEELQLIVAVIEEYLGREKTEQLIVSQFRAFSVIRLEPFQLIVAVIEEYLGREKTEKLIVSQFRAFSVIRLEPFQLIVALIEEYLGREKTEKLIVSQFQDFSVIKLEPFQQIIQELQRFLDEQKIARLIQKHLKLFSVLDPERFSQALSILETTLNISQMRRVIAKSVMEFAEAIPFQLQQTISFLKEELWTEEEIELFVIQNPQIFFSIQPYHLRYIAQELKSYAGVERARSIVKSSLHKISQVDQKTFDQTPISVWIQEWTPMDIYKFKNQRGYISFARKYFKGSMRAAWDYAKDSMTPENFNDLNWSYFKGKVEDFLNIKAVFANPKNRIVYRGMEGYQKLADEYFNGYMYTTFQYVYQAIPEPIFKKLRWKFFIGFTSDFQSLQKELFDKNGELKTEYFGMYGQALLTQKLQEVHGAEKQETSKKQSMDKTYTNVKAVLSEEDFGKLQWKNFFGTVQEFNLFRDRILDSEGNIRTEYIGLKGQIKFASRYYNGVLTKAYNHSRVILDSLSDLKWKSLNISSKSILKLQKSLESEGGIIVLDGFTGYVEMADTYFGGDMKITYEVMLALTGSDVMKQKGWRKYYGSTSQYKDLPSILLNPQGVVTQQYVGLEGYKEFALKYAHGNMTVAYSNVSVALGIDVIKRLKWKSFAGSTEMLDKVQKNLLDSQSSAQLQYREMEGHMLFADKYFKGNMEKAFRIVSAMASEEVMTQLNWTIFKGTTTQLKDLIQLFKETEIDKLKDLEGLNKVAELVFSRKRKAAYINVSAYKRYLFESDDPRAEFSKLNWSRSYF